MTLECGWHPFQCGWVGITAIFAAGESKVGEVLNCSKFSSLDKILRIISYDLRFLHNLQTKLQNFNDYGNVGLSIKELIISQEHLLKYEYLYC